MKRILLGALIAIGVLVPLALADTLTTNLLLNKQTVGGNINTWGTINNANFQTIDDKLGKVTTINTTGGTTVLATSEEHAQTIKVTGALVSNATLQFSGRGGIWLIDNQTTGAFSLTAKLSGQPGVNIVQGEDAIVYSDTTDIKSPISIPESAVPIGAVSDFAGATAPSGWLLAYGQCVSDSTYAALRTVIVATFGTSGCSAGNFLIPDLRGRVVAGDDDMGGTSANRLVDGTDTLNGDTLGDTGGVEFQTIAEAELPAHTHTGPSHTHTGPSHTHSFSATTSSDEHTHSYSDKQRGGQVERGSGGVNVNTGEDDDTRTTAADAHTHTVSGTAGAGGTGNTGASGTGATSSTGSGTPMAVVQPTMILNKIIYAGV